MESRELFFAFALGVVMLGAYLALGIWAIRTASSWVVPLKARWLRAVLVSFLATVIFAPGLVGSGHGVGVAPAWLMFATGTFSALASDSKQTYLLALLLCWVAVFAVTWALMGRRKET